MREFIDATEFKPPTLAVIEQANAIIDDYEQLGFTLTLRQLFYQFVSKDLIANDQSEYSRLGRIVRDARRAGYIDWSAIEDRTRFLRSLPTWYDPAHRIADAAASYREDVWATQPYRPEVFIEKDALVGVIEGVCDEFRVPYFSCRGNMSDSEMYVAAKRLDATIDQGQIPIVLHLWDHDPSGLDMTRDIDMRLTMFTRREYARRDKRIRQGAFAFNSGIEVRRLALNFDQTTSLPPNTAKESDSKWASYVKQFGPDSWELDALDPTFIADLIRDEVTSLIDAATWADALAQESANRDKLTMLAQLTP
jgi:hypothetical protein